MAKFTPPDYYGELPKLAQDILRKAFSQIADVIGTPSVSPDVETVEAILTLGPPRRVTPGTTGMRAVLPAPSADNAGETFSILIEDPLGAIVVNALPYRDAGGKSRDTTVNGAATATFATAGQVSFISNGIDRYVTSFPATETASGSASPISSTTFSANTTGAARAPDNLQLTIDNSVAARIAGRLVQLAANSNGVLLRLSTGALGFSLINTDNLLDGLVTEPKLATDSVTTIKVVDGNITQVKLATDSVSTIKIVDEAVTNPKLAHMTESTIKGRSATGGTGDVEDLTGVQAGAIVRDFTRQVFVCSIAGGTGPGGKYTSNDVIILADTRTLVLDATAATSPASPIVFTGFASDDADGHQVRIAVDSSNAPHYFILEHSSGDEPTSANGIFTADANDTMLTGSRPSVKMVYRPIGTSATTRWMIEHPNTQEFTNTSLSAQFDVWIHDGVEYVEQRLSGSDLTPATVGTTELEDDAVTLPKLAHMAAGTIRGNPVDAVGAAIVDMSGTQQGSSIRWNTQQNFSCSPGGGPGAGGVYTSAFFVINPETTQVIITSTITSTPASPIQITGFDGADGQEIIVRLDSGNSPHHVEFLHGSGLDPVAANQMFMSDARSFIFSGTRSSVVFRRELFDSASASLRWMARRPCTQDFENTTSSVALDLWIHDGTVYEERQLVPNDLNGVELLVQVASDTDHLKTGDVIAFPDNLIIRARGKITWPTNTRFTFGSNIVLKGYSRAGDQWTVSTAGHPAFLVGANPESFEIINFGLIQTSATGDCLAMADTNAERITLSRFLHVGNGGRGVDIAAADINCDAIDIQSVSHPFTLTAGGTVAVINGALLLQTVGGSSNPVLDLGSSSNKFVFFRFANILSIAATGGVNVVGAASNGNLTSTGTGSFENMTFAGTGTNLSGITEDDLQLIFQGCKNQQNSHFSGGYSMNGNATATANSAVAVGVYVKIAGTTVQDTVHRMNMSANNQMTVDRLEPATYIVTANLSITKSGAAKHLCSFGIFADMGSGFSLVSPPMSIEVSNVLNAVTVQVIVDLTTTDKIDVRAANNTSATDLVIEELSVTLVEG